VFGATASAGEAALGNGEELDINWNWLPHSMTKTQKPLFCANRSSAISLSAKIQSAVGQNKDMPHNKTCGPHLKIDHQRLQREWFII
jgi:hypothetical protein